MAVAVLPVPGFAVFAAPVCPVLAVPAAPVFVALWPVAFVAFLAEAAGALPEDSFAASLPCEVLVVADFFEGVFATGFASAAVLSAGFAVAEVAEESCAALEAGACCASAGAKKTVPASNVKATPQIVDSLEKGGFCIPIFWHPALAGANK